MQRPFAFFLLIVLSAYLNVANAQRKKKENTPPPAAVKLDTTKRNAVGPPGQPRPYRDVITNKAITSKGMFNVHKIDDKYFFEIPNEMFGRDILVVARISKAAAGARKNYAGDEIGSNTVRFEKGLNNRVFMKRMSFREIGRDSTEGMYRNVMNSNLQPIVASFDVKAAAPNNGAVIDVTEYINGDNEYFFFSPGSKRASGVGPIMSDKSYVQNVRAFSNNVEIKTVKTYSSAPPSPTGGMMPSPSAGGADAASGPVTLELNTSMVLLPKVPMQPRYFDDRVGYFTTAQVTDFDLNPQGIDRYSYIARYRLEPKTEDIEKYKRGELVEPKKQIVYYVDPTTPKKWIPYLIQGVNDWKVAFEKAGFKNAIVAKIAPTYQEDSTFSLEDAQHSAIIYKPSDIPNASGPNINDPRSGEIMESHINWYHNVMSLVRNWYMIQASSIDPKARKMEFDDELMGQLIRFVSSHEVGHTLGLRHNFGSSSTVPTEKLRDKAWVEANGHTPSIMDYARFNYVAQPEDNISEAGIFPRIGDYDKWAIEWGYRWYPEAKNADAEVALLNKITIDKLKTNQRLWWGDGESNRDDPRSQTEDLSDNAMKASSYGVKNLKRLVLDLPKYTYQANKDYDNLETMYSEVANQLVRYTGHVARNIGGIERTPKRVEQNGPVYEFTPKATQKEAMAWLQSNIFTTPTWLVQKNISSLTGQDPLTIIGKVQEAGIGNIVNQNTIGKLIKFEAADASKAYTANDMLNDVRRSVFSELASRKAIDIYRRQLQKIFVGALTSLADAGSKQTQSSGPVTGMPQRPTGGNSNSDVISVTKGQLRTLASEIRAAANSYGDVSSKNHLLDLQDRIKEVLDPK